ncbi:sigma-70 family RNA polymerase sigma factor [Niabella pedocola]|uniref:Sigma-70 family RNA polymerase sigma factor n=1 Tax=Niabella pedocola TaxID=1752077 RepID=A0ABS8PUC8_9BACT|nr:sigma-70 family RNA polymerase sigma factor [Niabella pedocola]MCD2424495.1 sigma-70 family RNA polymerase sigma factor [Niabella pedocola]
MNKEHTYREDELVLLLKQRDAQAFGYLYDHYAASLNGIICSFVTDEQYALDALQECFVKIWNQVQAYDASKGRLFTWLAAVARNTAIDMLRSRNWKNTQQHRELSGAAHTIPATSGWNMDTIGLRGAVKNLREEYRQVIELAYFEGMSHSDIAAETGMPVGTVKTRLRAALIELRKFIK